MATALQLPSPDHGSALNELLVTQRSPAYARRLTISEFDFKDTRYPTLAPSSSRPVSSSNNPAYSNVDRSLNKPMTDPSRASWIEYSPIPINSYSNAWVEEKPQDSSNKNYYPTRTRPRDFSPAPRHQAQFQMTEATNPSSLRPGSSPNLGDNRDRDERLQRVSSNSEQSRVYTDPGAAAQAAQLSQQDMGQRLSGLDQFRESPTTFLPSTPRHPSLPAAGIGAGPSTATLSPIVPLSAGPAYNPGSMPISISPTPRAYAQQPTYITPPSAPNPMNTVYTPQVPKEEVCVECAMRDQDMADVDVTTPGIWERESDVLYDELLRREEEDEANGVVLPENCSRPRAKGGSLTEENLKFWLSINPKEPSSRAQTLDQYVKSQRALLEKEALAHARAMRESRQLDDKMRDAYSQLRRSAYELGSGAQPADELGGVRIKAPRSASVPSAVSKSNGREVTLLENGMIVEHVDVRKEERGERERRKKEEKRERSRARKSSRSSRSAVDVVSIYSQNPVQQTDSGFFSGMKSDARLSQSWSARPSSVVTNGDRPQTLLRAQSQASFSDMQSIGSAGAASSPRRSRFFGLQNFSSGWKSQDSFAPSGSMIDMHVALSREQHYLQAHPNQGVDIGSNAPTLRLGESWPQAGATLEPPVEVQAAKKPKGLKKIWKIVTGAASKGDALLAARAPTRSSDKAEDDLPLAPPPSLSYLVNQRSASPRRHVSTPPLPSSSPNPCSMFGSSPASPHITQAGLMPGSPVSSRPSGADKDTSSEGRKNSGNLGTDHDDRQHSRESPIPESDSRGRTTQGSSRTLSSVNGPLTPATPPSARLDFRRDKSLPPLPGESTVEFPNHPMPDGRPQTIFTYDTFGMNNYSGLVPPQAPFRMSEIRRQSFHGVGSQGLHSLPTRGMPSRPQPAPFQLQNNYGEFGASRMSLGTWTNSQRSLQVPDDQKPKKRRSRFGLASLFGKKSSSGPEVEPTKENIAESVHTGFRESQSDWEAGHESGYASPLSMHSGYNSRMSVFSKRNIEELVSQEPEFVAYRYPSNDQRLDLVR